MGMHVKSNMIASQISHSIGTLLSVHIYRMRCTREKLKVVQKIPCGIWCHSSQLPGQMPQKYDSPYCNQSSAYLQNRCTREKLKVVKKIPCGICCHSSQLPSQMPQKYDRPYFNKSCAYLQNEAPKEEARGGSKVPCGICMPYQACQTV